MSGAAFKRGLWRAARKTEGPPGRAIAPTASTALPYTSKALIASTTSAGAHAAAARLAQQALLRRRRSAGQRVGGFLTRVAKALSISSGGGDGGENNGNQKSGRRRGGDGTPSPPSQSRGSGRNNALSSDDEGLVAPLLPPLEPGQVIRDFPFFTQNADVQFFSTHPALLDDVFGVAHGQRLLFRKGAWAGQRGTVIGARGGALWVLLATESIARELPLPPVSTATATWTATMATETASGDRAPRGEVREGWNAERIPSLIRRRLETHYGMERICSSDVPTDRRRSSTAKTKAASADAEGQKGVKEEEGVVGGLPPTLLRAVEAQITRLYSPEQRAFLQCAPDLFVSALDDGDIADAEAATAGDGIAIVDDTMSLLSEGTHLAGGALREGAEQGRGDAFRVDGESESHVTFYQRIACEAAGVVPYGQCKTVVLSPLIVAASGTLGWGGEGVVVVDGGGVHAFTASMSAAIVM